MAGPNCPICYAPLEVRDVAPCFDCGAHPAELLHLTRGLHTYDEVRTLGEIIVLCDYCQVDFSSYKPVYFNLPDDVKLGRDMAFRCRIADPRITKDKYCPECGRRLAFLQFLSRVRSTRAR